MNKEMTAYEALASWDEGKPIWSVSMGGLGPSYEQAIQNMAFEILRSLLIYPPEWERMGDDKLYAEKYRDKIEKTTNVSKVVEYTQPSGAQFGAAMNLAMVIARQGYAVALGKVPEERHILVSYQPASGKRVDI